MLKQHNLNFLEASIQALESNGVPTAEESFILRDILSRAIDLYNSHCAACGSPNLSVDPADYLDKDQTNWRVCDDCKANTLKYTRRLK